MGAARVHRARAALVVLAAIDLEHFLLPNRIVYPLAVVTIALLALAAIADGHGDAFVRALLAGLVAFGAFLVLHLISPRSMGFGDVKLSFTLGLALGWIGWGEVFLGLFLGFFYGAVIGMFLIATAPAVEEPTGSLRSVPRRGNVDRDPRWQHAHRLVPRGLKRVARPGTGCTAIGSVTPRSELVGGVEDRLVARTPVSWEVPHGG